MATANFVIPYSPGFPITVAGQVITEETITFMRKLDVKEIHGYNPDLGLSVFTEAALARIEAQRNAATAALGSAFPAFEIPSDASSLNGALNGNRNARAVTEDA